MVLAIAVLLPALAVLGDTVSYKDDFSEGGYSGNDGTYEFVSDWREIGESNGPGSGNVYVAEHNCSSDECLQLAGPRLVAQQLGIERSADLSMFNSANLRFDLRIEPGDGLLLPSILPENAQLKVLAWNGGSWGTLATYDLSEMTSPTGKNIPVPNAYYREDFAVRFVVPSGALVVFTGLATIDKVELSGAANPPPEPSSTTSTSSTTTTTTTTTTTAPSTTTTSPTTSTSGTPTTEAPATTTSTTSAPTTSVSSSTSTTRARSSTTIAVAAAGTTPPAPPVFDGGLRDPGMGLMADYHQEMNGDMSMLDDVEVLSAEVTADFSLAVEAIESAKVWLAALSLMIAAALVSGMDSRRKRRIGAWPASG